ncbi:MAG: hypothetical protein LQ343_004442 [Gyalolechia ehrenbergii]|nr:MAG: hypothetical protein LQ343_004442 [Gyalolechia ehrenbergii]
MLSFSDPLMIPLVYHRKADKDDFWTHGALGEHAPTLQTLKHTEHVKKRRMVSAAAKFKLDQRVLNWEEKLRRYATVYSRIDIALWVKRHLYGNSADLIFGKSGGFAESGGDEDTILHATRHSAWLIGLMTMFPYVLRPLRNVPGFNKLLLPKSGDRSGIGKIMTVRDNLIKQSEGSKSPTLKNNLQEYHTLHPTSTSQEDVDAELLLLMIATPDTTSAFICASIDNILHAPAIHSRVVSEVKTFVSQHKLHSPVASYAEIKRIPYLTACIWEAARLCPSIPVVIPRRVSPGGLWVSGYYIPEGTSIGASPSVINRDVGIFGPQTDQFRPERWLERTDEEVAKMHKFLFSWGFGARQCAGKDLALMMTFKVCLQLFRDFDIEPTSASSGRAENKGFAVYENLLVNLRAGDDSEADIGDQGCWLSSR